jgi:hypothetical protein
MTDFDLHSQSSSSQRQDNKQGQSTTQNLRDQVTDAGAEMKERAGDAFRASTDAARNKFKEAADAAKGVAAGAADELQDKAREQQRTGADFIGRFAGNIRDAARAFEGDAPFAARGINTAAEYVEDAAEKIRNGSFRDLIDDATDFAKRQPAAFLGLSVLAGFAVVRFLKASGTGSSSSWNSESSSSWNDVPSSRNEASSFGNDASSSFRNDASSSRNDPSSFRRGGMS